MNQLQAHLAVNSVTGIDWRAPFFFLVHVCVNRSRHHIRSSCSCSTPAFSFCLVGRPVSDPVHLFFIIECRRGSVYINNGIRIRINHNLTLRHHSECTTNSCSSTFVHTDVGVSICPHRRWSVHLSRQALVCPFVQTGVGVTMLAGRWCTCP